MGVLSEEGNDLLVKHRIAISYGIIAQGTDKLERTQHQGKDNGTDKERYEDDPNGRPLCDASHLQRENDEAGDQGYVETEIAEIALGNARRPRIREQHYHGKEHT